MRIDELPPETIEEILLHADPTSVASLSQCSRFFDILINHGPDQHLWRWLYLIQQLDDPRECVSLSGDPRKDIDWKGELQAFIRARRVVKDVTVCRPAERCAILRTMIHLVEYVPPRRGPYNGDMSKNLAWIRNVLGGGAFIDPETFNWVPTDPEEIQLRDKLHTYLGITPADRTPRALVKSRAYVYDFRNYSWETDFGPFFEDGKVNWEHLRMVRHVLAMHVHGAEATPLQMSLEFTQIQTVALENTRDWAGIEGIWWCGFCFCDHSDLTLYNLSTMADGSLDVSLFEDPGFNDVFRSVEVTIRVLEVSPDPKHPKYPRIYFGGSMGQHSMSTMSGYVHMTDDNQVRWRFRSGEQVNPIWSSEGIQVGGLRALYGVLGTWTTTFHNPNDPVGPFWLRKAIDLPQED
ncbi:uncharacterized protein BT62DRAFT_1006657 [Guyanagaster necrorhizus]|uniref:F-box domain-containing protein n=1 Tax=Guyanagaster necrorhizus TaxID=856835 RepID=A0A9P7VS30_9AGAR|nr:uncharacterized protein BT62DRAFT_1006657 [Guyanagaster necrorhizus MCA 3950]KAG7445628.1 hypothetical protein BT62DRAFT_1006657 [Guyanagaster necrorhizus MCA 3950]